MNCPGCGGTVAAGQERCLVCSAVLAPGVEGNLAPKLEPIRELPALRRRDRDKDKEREKNWKDEVSERVKRRRTARTATRSELAAKSELPLFRDLEDTPAVSPEVPNPPAPHSEPAVTRVERPGSSDADGDLDLPLRPLEELFEAAPGAAPAMAATEEFPPDAPDGRMELGTLDAVVAAAVTLGGEEAAPRRTPREVPRFALEGPSEEEPMLVAPTPRLHPARAFERLSAGAVDALVLGLLASIVLYFTLRLTRVGLPGLLPTWPWLGGYLALVALAYATYFSGTTGQTPGKMLTGIRVVDGEGRPPSYLRAFLRAALAGLGIAALGVGLVPLLLDSRSGALHDRITGTRVVKG